eukprot:875927-Amphidinium_carterae.1
MELNLRLVYRTVDYGKEKARKIKSFQLKRTHLKSPTQGDPDVEPQASTAKDTVWWLGTCLLYTSDAADDTPC